MCSAYGHPWWRRSTNNAGRSTWDQQCVAREHDEGREPLALFANGCSSASRNSRRLAVLVGSWDSRFRCKRCPSPRRARSRRGDVEALAIYQPRQAVEQAEPIAGLDLDDRAFEGQFVVTSTLGRERCRQHVELCWPSFSFGLKVSMGRGCLPLTSVSCK